MAMRLLGGSEIKNPCPDQYSDSEWHTFLCYTYMNHGIEDTDLD